MVQWSEEWMEQMIAQASRDVPVPMPANLKESVMNTIARKQRFAAGRKAAFYNLRLGVAACLAFVLLTGTGVIIQKVPIDPSRQEPGWLQGIQKQMDSFALELNNKMNAIVCVQEDTWENKGGK